MIIITNNCSDKSIQRGQVFKAEDKKALGNFCKAVVFSCREIMLHKDNSKMRVTANDDMTVLIPPHLDFDREILPYKRIAESLELLHEVCRFSE